MGNVYFSSVNQMSYNSPSRRDDLHSLVYLLIYLANRCSIPAIDAISQNDKISSDEKIDLVLAAKKKLCLN